MNRDVANGLGRLAVFRRVTWSTVLVVIGLLLSCPTCTTPTPSLPDVQDEEKGEGFHLLYLPQRTPRLDAPGPIVPGTPGLRVPAGYITRVRLDIRDLFLPYTVASFLRGAGDATLRIEAVAGMTEDRRILPVFRVLIPITLPSGSDIAALTELTLGPAALSRAMATIRLENGRQYLVEVKRLSFDALEEGAVKGSLEGRARRGMKSKSYKQIKVGFVALRAPDTGMLGSPAQATDSSP